MYRKICMLAGTGLTLVWLAGISFAGQCNWGQCIEMNSNGTSSTVDDCQPNDGLDDGQCFQNSFQNGPANDVGYHIPSGEWNINTVPGSLLFRTGMTNFSIFGDGNSSKMVFSGAITMLFAGSEGYVGDFQIVKSAGSTPVDHILSTDNANRVTINNIEFWLNSRAAGLKVHDSGGLYRTNGIVISNLRVVGGKGITAATKGVVLNIDLPHVDSFDVRVIGLIAPGGMTGLLAGESALYENGNSGGVWDFIDVNPPSDAILLDVLGGDRTIYQRFLTAPGNNSVSVVRIKHSKALDFSHWQIVGNPTTSTAHVFQTLADPNLKGCEGCSFTNIIFDRHNISGGADYFNLAASPAVEIDNNIWRDSDNSAGSSVVDAAGNSNQLRIAGNIKQGATESVDIQIAAGALSIVVDGNIGFGTAAPYQSAIEPIIINTPETGVLNQSALRSYTDGGLPGMSARDKLANVESYSGPADGNKVIFGSMTDHPLILRYNNQNGWAFINEGGTFMYGAASIGPANTTNHLCLRTFVVQGSTYAGIGYCL